jgi:hypothetical protein
MRRVEMELRTETKDIALELTKKFSDQFKSTASPDQLREEFTKTYKAMYKAVSEARSQSGEKPFVA